MDSHHHGNQLVKGAFILTLAGLISKILSAAYRIPLQNLTGDLGFYIYQQVYPFLGMMIIVSLYGFPSAIAKITAEMQGKGKQLSFRTVYGPLFIILFLMVAIGMIILFFNAETLARWMGDPQLTKAYQWVAVALLFVPLTSLLRGFFQGQQMMTPIAYSQVGEQIIRVAIIMTGAILIVNQRIDVSQMGVFGVIAAIFGAIIAICILFISLRKTALTKRKVKSRSIPWRYYLRILFMFGIVASLNHMVLLIIQFADVFTLVPNLRVFGLSQIDAMEAKGVFDRGQPLIQFGTVLGSSFALALIPETSKQKLTHSIPSIRSVLKISAYIAIGATIGLILIFKETNILLYQNAKGTSSLQVLSLSILLSTLSITFIAILQSIEKFKQTAIFIVGMFMVKWLLNIILVPYLGIMGSAIATVVSLLFLLIASMMTLKRQIPTLEHRRIISPWPLLIASGGMSVFLLVSQIFISYETFTSRFSLAVYVVMLAGIGACIYILLLIRSGAFTRKEIQMLPFSSLFMRIYKGGN